jgi:uncharacterized protein YprB with RNaseH-like and TPR domain
MRDLAARLREIVQTDRKSTPGVDFGPETQGTKVGGSKSTPGVDFRRELTYVPDLGFGQSPDSAGVAAQLGGTVHEAHGGACVVIDRTWTPDQSHGRRRVESYAIDPTAPIGLFDPRLSDRADWASRVVFFDIETTGLSGGAGMIAFLAGCGWFEMDGGFTVRQFLLTGPAGERALLELLEGIFAQASLLVTFNGRTFDLPVMDMRWAFHRRDTPTLGLPHFDMLPPARRLWGRVSLAERQTRPHDARRYASDERASCSLSSLERSVLGFHRLGDVPGFEIPTRYFQFLRTGDAAAIEGVLEHNRHDLISLAAVTSHALWLGREGPEACRQSGEQIGLGRLYERAGDEPRAARAYEMAAAGTHDRETQRHALARLAVLMRRDDRHEEAAAAWESVLGPVAESGADARRPLSALERRAAEALAIHHEHRVRNPLEAKRYASLLKTRSVSGPQQDVEHRLGRLARKIDAAQKEKSGHGAAPLLDD